MPLFLVWKVFSWSNGEAVLREIDLNVGCSKVTTKTYLESGSCSVRLVKVFD